MPSRRSMSASGAKQTWCDRFQSWWSRRAPFVVREQSALHRTNGFQPPVKLLSQRIQCLSWAWAADMRRRDFIKVIGSTVTWPLAAHAQVPARVQQKKIPTIGFLGGGTADSVWSSWAAAFVSRLAEL